MRSPAGTTISSSVEAHQKHPKSGFLELRELLIHLAIPHQAFCIISLAAKRAVRERSWRSSPFEYDDISRFFFEVIETYFGSNMVRFIKFYKQNVLINK